ncbi:unnamed protein product, partial [marine sediment metagenome]
HRLTATRAGYTTQQVTIKPSQSIYTLTMQSSSGNATYVEEIEGVRWIIRPSIGTIEPGAYNFNATITSTDAILEYCKFELLNTNASVITSASSTATNSTDCFVGLDYTVIKDINLFGRLSIDTDATTGYVIVDSDSKWVSIDIDKKSWRGIIGFFQELRTLNEFGEETNTRDFSRFVFFFLLTTILIGIFTYFSGFELQNPGISILIIVMIILFASAGGFLTFDSASSNVSGVMGQWGFFFIFLLLTLGYMLNTIRRHGE